MGGRERWSATQTQSLHDQMCAGYRVFDLRFRKKSGSWRIHHGGSYYSDVAAVGNQFQAFCNEGQGSEVIILRLKVEKNVRNADDWVDCIDQLRTAIDAGAKNCVVHSAGQQLFTDRTSTQLRNLFPAGKPAGSPVIIMPYVPGNYNAVSTRLFTAGGAAPDPEPYVFNYAMNQFGKSAETLKVTKVLRTTGKGQEKKRHDWALKKAGPPAQPHLTFGFWMTMTGKLGYLNVVKNTKKLFDGAGNGNHGKYKNWICKLDAQYRPRPGGMSGWTIWTDFAGDARMASVAAGGVAINAGPLVCPANTPNPPWSNPALLNP